MTKIKTSLVALVLLLSVGVTISVNASSKKLEVLCSQYPNGQGVVGNPYSYFGCSSPASNICCYELGTNKIYYKIFP